MSTPKINRKTPQPKGQRIHAHSEQLRQTVLGLLQQHTNKPVTDLRQLTGADKSQLNNCVEWPRLRGHTILSLASGYILLSDTLPTFPDLPTPDPLACKQDGDQLIVSNGRATSPYP